MTATEPGPGFSEALLDELRRRHEEPTDHDVALRRAADAVRRLTAVVVTADLDVAALEQLASDVEAVVAPVAGRVRASRYRNPEPTAETVMAGFATQAVGGRANPVAVPYEYEDYSGSVVRARVQFGPVYEGTPGVVHGGFVAATFDHLLGAAAARAGALAVTGTLTVRYRQPTPLNTELCFETWVEKLDGRKLVAAGRVIAGEVVTAEAESLFIRVDPAQYLPGEIAK